jgi:hypothetical protein
MGDIKLIGEDIFSRKLSKDRAHGGLRTPKTAQPTTTRLFGSSDSEYFADSDGRASSDESGTDSHPAVSRVPADSLFSGAESNGNGGDKTDPPYPIFGRVMKRIDPCHKALEIQKWYAAQLSMAENSEQTSALEQAVWHWLKDKDPTKYETAAHRPCVVCHAKTLDAVDSILDQDFGFSSCLNLRYNDYESYTWSFGAQYIVQEKLDWTLDPKLPPVEVVAARLLRAKTKVPIPAVAASWKEGNVAITITERARGTMLSEAWKSLKPDEKNRIAIEVAGYVKQWRRLTSKKMCGLDGRDILITDLLIGGSNGRPMNFASEKDYWISIARQLKERDIDEGDIKEAKSLMPLSTPFVFTHGNLNLGNIFIEDGRVSAIVGLDRAAFLPAWAEFLAAHFRFGSHEREWQDYLCRHINKYPGARMYWDLCAEWGIAHVDLGPHAGSKTMAEAAARRKTVDMKGCRTGKEMDAERQVRERKKLQKKKTEKEQQRKKEKLAALRRAEEEARDAEKTRELEPNSKEEAVERHEVDSKGKEKAPQIRKPDPNLKGKVAERRQQLDAKDKGKSVDKPVQQAKLPPLRFRFQGSALQRNSQLNRTVLGVGHPTATSDRRPANRAINDMSHRRSSSAMPSPSYRNNEHGNYRPQEPSQMSPRFQRLQNQIGLDVTRKAEPVLEQPVAEEPIAGPSGTELVAVDEDGDVEGPVDAEELMDEDFMAEHHVPRRSRQAAR